MQNEHGLRLSWLAQALGVPLFKEQDSGVVLNAAAQGLVGTPSAEGLSSTLMRLPGVVVEAQDVARVRRAVTEGPQSLVAGSWRLIFVLEAGGLGVMAVPQDYARMGELYRRAASADATAGVAHELSNALGAIVGWIELAVDRPDAAPALRALEAIRESASAARHSAQGLLGMARPDDEVATQDVYLLLRQVLTVAQPQARGLGVALELIGEPGAFVLVSRSDLFTIFWNVVKNALEAIGGPGNVVVTTRRRDGKIEVDVRDDGPGISEADRDRVFERYVTSKPSGSGVGLSLVHDAVLRARGDVSVAAVRPRGTEFQFRFPMVIPVDEPELDTARSSWSPTPAGFHVLVVDDDLAMRDLIGTTYTLRGAEVTLAATVDEVANGEGHYDLAIVDLHVGSESGQRLLERLLATHRLRVGCLMSGGEPPADWPADALNLGWIRKPFELEELHNLLKRAILVTRAPA